METTTSSNKLYTPLSPDGIVIGQSATADYVGFYGATPIVQPTNSSQAAVTVLTDTSGGTGALGTGLQALTSTYNSTITANSISSVALAVINLQKLVNRMRLDLVNLGLIKGS